MEITDIPDFPALQQLANALWGGGSRRGAAAFVGAGFSKFADLSGADTLEPPLWNDLTDLMAKQLYRDPSLVPKDQLRVAEEYRTYFGQAALDQFIRRRISDEAWLPAMLHRDLLELPWADVLTTNWDTLLERAAHNVNEIVYEPVRSITELAHARAPRIVKLHGSIGTSDHFIVAEEDYRTYPTRFAGFVNFARQVFIENELCLIGFSGDDPNFLQWSGWVRDNLGSDARRIFLVGVLNLSEPKRKFFEARNLAPIDLGPLVTNLDHIEKHSVAIRCFLDFLAKSKPVPVYDWEPAPSEAYHSGKTPEDRQREFRDAEYAASVLDKAANIWKADRLSYPGWLIPPFDRRRALERGIDVVVPVRAGTLDAINSIRRNEIVYELCWRHITAHLPIPDVVAEFAARIADPEHPCGLERHKQLEMAVTLLRRARQQHDEIAFTRWAAVLEKNSPADSETLAEVTYARCLYARDHLDYQTLDSAQQGISGPDPIWRIRRASILAEVGRISEAGKLVTEALSDLHVRQRQNRNSLWTRSRRAWAEWLAIAIQRDNFHVRSERLWLGEFRESRCDPETEIDILQDIAQRKLRKKREDAVHIKPLFESGYYKDAGETLHLTTENDGDSLESIDLLIEVIGIPLRLNHGTLLSSLPGDALELAFDGSFKWYAWFIRNLHSSLDDIFDRRFNRIFMAQLSAANRLALSKATEAGIQFWRKRLVTLLADASQNSVFCVERLRTLIDVLSRLTPQMSPAEAKKTFAFAMELGGDRNLRHWWLFEPIGNLAKFSGQAIPVGERPDLILSALKFPLSSEIGSPPGVPAQHWPNPISFLFDVQPKRPSDESDWTQRIRELILAAKTNTSREEAVLRLAYLAKRDSLREPERKAFAEALWCKLDDSPHPLPTNTRMLAYAFAELPAPNEVDSRERVTARLFDVEIADLLTVPARLDSRIFDRKRSWLTALAASAQSPAKPTAIQARIIFDRFVQWRPLASHDPDDPFRASFLASFDKTNRQLIGEVLANVVVPALDVQERNSERARALLTLITEAKVYSTIAALPYFWGQDTELDLQITHLIRRALSAENFEQVGSAASAIESWAKISTTEKSALPADLIEQVIFISEAGRTRGLHAVFECARNLLDAKKLSDDQISRILRVLENLTVETTYDRIDPDSVEAISIPLVRSECVRIAKALVDAGHNTRAIAQWLETYVRDPLPEVRFALELSTRK